MSGTGINKRRIVVTILLSFFSLSVVWILLGLFSRSVSGSSIDLSEGWSVDFGGKHFDNVTAGAFRFGVPSKGEALDMEHEIPEIDRDYTLRLLTYLSSVEAYIDGEEIHSFGVDRMAAGKFVGSGYQFIRIPSNASGKTVKIHIVFNERNAFNKIDNVSFEPSTNALKALAREKAVIFFVGSFMMVFGFLLVTIGFTVLAYDSFSVRLIMIGLLACLVGLWTLCTNRLYELFNLDDNLFTEIEYLSLYFMSVPLMVLVLNCRKNLKGIREVILKIAFVLVALYGVVAFVLHLTGLVTLNGALEPFHIFAIIMFTIVLVTVFFKAKQLTKSDFVMGLGSMILSLTVVMDILRYNSQRLIEADMGFLLRNSFIPLGAVIFTTVLTISYLFALYEMNLTSAEKEMLTRLAYHDDLTGLWNRTKSMQVIKELEKTGGEVAIISFDVNRLKYVNDTFGHAEGDRMLKIVADALRKCFDKHGSFYRISGDEFMAIIIGEEIVQIDGMLVDFDRAVVEGSEGLPYRLTVSYGVALRSETHEKELHKTMMLADSRMYEMKAIRHKELAGEITPEPLPSILSIH